MTRWQRIDCPDCYEGETVRITARYSTSFGNYLPYETYHRCDTCDGDGELWVAIEPADDVDEVYFELDYHDLQAA